MTNSDLILLLVQLLIEERDNNKKLTAKLNDKRKISKWFLHNDKKRKVLSILSFLYMFKHIHFIFYDEFWIDLIITYYFS